MSKPIIAVVGRPNVGKSTLFNYIAGRRISIVDDHYGVTRDRIYSDFEWRDRWFTLIDTGGIETDSEEHIKVQTRQQAQTAIETADVIIFLVDNKSGLTPEDRSISEMLRRSGKKIILAVNKVDNVGQLPPEVFEFYELGYADVFPVSSTQRLGLGELLDAVYELAEESDGAALEDEGTKVAIIGKPNSGKSSLINKIAGQERMIVSEQAGTTRDAIDTVVEIGDKKYTFIDTAGIRKKKKISGSVEYYSIIRALNAVERADVCLILIDAQEGVTEQDTKVAGIAHEAGKACIIVVNKWDLVIKDTKTLERYKKEVGAKLAFMPYAPIVFISAMTGQRINKLPELIDYVADQASIRIRTGMLNDVLNEAVTVVPPPTDKGRELKIYYMTQIGIKPPSFVIFINSQKLFHFSYSRYIENTLRRNFGFEGSVIRLIAREKGDGKK